MPDVPPDASCERTFNTRHSSVPGFLIAGKGKTANSVCLCGQSGSVLLVAGIVGVASNLHTRDHISKGSEKRHQEKFQKVKSPILDIRHC